MSQIKLGDWLRRKRLDASLTQKEIAVLTVYDHTYVSRVERGDQQPAQEYLTRFLQALRVSEPEQAELWRLYQAEFGPKAPLLENQLFPPHHQDLFDILDVSVFYGRNEELRTLSAWLIEDHCRLVGIFGMGGIGKTLLAAKVMAESKHYFEGIYWCSLKNAPPITHILNECFSCLSHQQSVTRLTDPGELISQLLQLMRQHRYLIVLDNLETIMQGHLQVGYYREGYEFYGDFIQQVGETHHQSCLLVTSREMPREFARLKGETGPIRTLLLRGLGVKEGEAILKDKGLASSHDGLKALIERSSGNPLALKLLAETIRELYGGNTKEFLQETTLVFGDIRELLDQQFVRLSTLERDILYWLAVEREPITLESLFKNFAQSPMKTAFLDALHSLCRRSLIESSLNGFTLQNVILEYMTDRLVYQAYEEIECEAIDEQKGILPNYALIKAQAKDYVREHQVRTLLQPLTTRLITNFDLQRVEQKLQQLLKYSQLTPTIRLGYAGGNILNLLAHLNLDLTRYDFSHLTIRQAHLPAIHLREVNFSCVHFIGSVFSEVFQIISAVTVSPNGQFIAVGDAKGQLRLWLTTDNTPFLTRQAHNDWILSVAFSPSSDVIATGSEDATIKLWAVKTNQLITTMYGHTGRVRSVVFSPDGLILASAGDDHIVRLWDVITGHCRSSLGGHRDWIRSLGFSPDGHILVSGSDDCSIQIWDVHSGYHVGTLLGHTSQIIAVVFHPHGEIIASSARDHTIRFWNIHTLQCLNIVSIDSAKNVNNLAFSPDGRFLAVPTRTIDLWEMSSGSFVITFYGHKSRIRDICFTPDGNTLVSGSEDSSVKLWDIQTGQCIRTFHGFNEGIIALAISPDGYTVASTNFQSAVRLWRIDTKQFIQALSGYSNWVSAVAFNPDGTLLASGDEDYVVKVWRVRDSQCLHSLQGHRRRIRSVAFSSDNILLASGSTDQTIRLWDVDTGQCKAVLTGHNDAVMSISFRPSSKTLASSSYDRTVKLWEVEYGQCINTFHGHTDWIRSIAFNLDGSVLASGSDDCTIRLWDVDTGQCFKILSEHTDRVRTVAFSPKEAVLASGCEDHLVRGWDINTGQCIFVLSGHTSPVTSLVFSPDGSLIISGSDDETIRIWNISTRELVAVLRNERLYQGMNITGATGLTQSQKDSLKLLGAIEK